MKIQGVLRNPSDRISIKDSIITINDDEYDLYNLKPYDPDQNQRFYILDNEINGLLEVDKYQFFIFINNNMKKFLGFEWDSINLRQLVKLVGYLNMTEEERRERNKLILGK